MSGFSSWTLEDLQQVYQILSETFPEKHLKFCQPIKRPFFLVLVCPTISSIELTKLDEAEIQVIIYPDGEELEIFLLKLTEKIKAK